MKKQSKTKNVVAIVAIVLCLFLGISLILPRLFKGSSAEGEKGDTGNGIHSIDKTATNGLTDTYTITFTDGSTYTYTLTNGEKGETGATGATGNGIQSIEKTATEGLVDTYTITFTNGSIYTYTVTNGADGESISGGTTIPAEAIIDVDELPQELEVYTLYNGEKNVFGDSTLTLREVDQENRIIYFNEDGEETLNKLLPILKDIKNIRICGSGILNDMTNIVNTSLTSFVIYNSSSNHISFFLGAINLDSFLVGELQINGEGNDVKMLFDKATEEGFASYAAFGMMIQFGNLIFET